MLRVTSAEFRQDTDRYEDAAQHAPVAITRNGRTHAVLMSAVLFELVTNGRVARLVEDLDEDTVRATAGSTVPEEFAELDRLVEDWKP
jgi:PHD/YefM family antitoxin component YafN of YafNO toxin-antitoxin module